MRRSYSLCIIILVVILIIPSSCIKTSNSEPAITIAQTPSSASIPPLGVTPGTPGAANDDIVYPPGGFTYRANVHQQGQPDWPPVLQNEVTLTSSLGDIVIQYRNNIETKAGETRNNIIFLDGRNAPSLADPINITYTAAGLPSGISVQRGEQMYGGIGGQDKKSSRVVLKISISSQIKPAEYSFTIGLLYEGKNIGNIPCAVKVIE